MVFVFISSITHCSAIGFFRGQRVQEPGDALALDAAPSV
jgi:hypothetical protein